MLLFINSNNSNMNMNSQNAIKLVRETHEIFFTTLHSSAFEKVRGLMGMIKYVYVTCRSRQESGVLLSDGLSVLLRIVSLHGKSVKP